MEDEAEKAEALRKKAEAEKAEADRAAQAEAARKAESEAAAANAAKQDVVPERASSGTYRLEQLKDPDQWRELGVPPTEREQYLEDSVFRELFGMSKQEFEKLPKWKK